MKKKTRKRVKKIRQEEEKWKRRKRKEREEKSYDQVGHFDEGKRKEGKINDRWCNS